ncbi:MAG: CDP-alcohol phosphatidyltransferase family protein, partial [Gammaproteobacteria bacterium]
MLDSHGQRFVQPVLTVIARQCLWLGISANALTVCGLMVGLIAGGLVACAWTTAGIVVLWLSGLLDAADGTLARLTRPSALGAIMDITFDRVVEVSIILALAWRFPDARLALLVLT